MKTIKIILCLLIANTYIFAQELYVNKFIGKSINDVLKVYGNPVHKDNSIPSMVSWFYQSKDKRYVFVSDKNGIIQSEASVYYSSIESAKAILDKFTSNSVKEGYTVDTLLANEFHLHIQNIDTDLSLIVNKNSNKIAINIKARKCAD